MILNPDSSIADAMSLVVQKYGGSSLATPQKVRDAALRVSQVKRAGNQLVVVVSAMGNVTSQLVALAKRTVRRPPQRELDMLLTAGERVSMALMAMALEEQGVSAISFTGSQVGIITSSEHNNARILEIRPKRVIEELSRDKVVIIAGFQGVSREKEITTLGRGGSDTTAVALAAALKADRCEILTDVDGLYTADPCLVPHAKKIGSCTPKTAIEFAWLGAKMHARSLAMAKRFGVSLSIGSSRGDSRQSTKINCGELKSTDCSDGIIMESIAIQGVACKSGFDYFRVASTLRPLAALLAEYHLPLTFFSSHENEVRFVVNQADGENLKGHLADAGIELESYVPSVSAVSIVGEGLLGDAKTIHRFLELFAKHSEKNLFITTNASSFVGIVPTKDASVLVEALHRELIEGEK